MFLVAFLLSPCLSALGFGVLLCPRYLPSPLKNGSLICPISADKWHLLQTHGSENTMKP